MVSKHSKKNKDTTPPKIQPVEPVNPVSPIHPVDPVDPLIEALLSAAVEDRTEPAEVEQPDGQNDVDSIIASLLASSSPVTPSASPVLPDAPSVTPDEPAVLPDVPPVAPPAIPGDFTVTPGDSSALPDEPALLPDVPPVAPPVIPGDSPVPPVAPPVILELPRERPVWPLIISAIVVLIILTGGLTYYNKTTLATQAVAAAEIQKQGDLLLDESIALIQEADSVVIALDKATENQVAEEDVPKLEALLGQLESTQRSLDTAIEKAGEAQSVYVDGGRRELAQHALDAAKYRKQMLDLSSQLVGYDIEAVESAVLLDAAWTLIVEADADMRSAVEVVAVGAGSAVTESRDYNQSAVDKLGQAQEKLTLATETFPGLDLKVLTDYLEVKKASAELALASDQAYLDGRYGDANSLNDEFYDKDAEAVELAARIPTNPLSLVVSAYDEAVKQLRENYAEIRSEAADADAFLRDYLDVDIQVGVE